LWLQLALLWPIQHVEITAEVNVDMGGMEDTVTTMGTAVDTTDTAITDTINRCIHSLV
jgi:hypothetical protein